MLSSVLNSPRAIAVNIQIMRTFVRMRALLGTNKELAKKLEELERTVSSHDQAIAGIFKSLHELMHPPRVQAIGFTADLTPKR